VVAEVMRVTPTDASEWLKCNRLNRPVRKSHVQRLAESIREGQWQVNGQAIVIADDEQVLDGQHRLFAIIEAGMPIDTLVVYGISALAFRTMDTGIVRTGADALCMHFPEISSAIVKAAATAVQWCWRLELGNIRGGGNVTRLSNTDVIDYCTNHPSLFSCAETLTGYPHEARPLSLGVGTALYELFARKHEDQAGVFMERLYTGEGLSRTDVEYLLRTTFIRDAERKQKYPMTTKVKMVIKGWNWKRRGNETAKQANIIWQPTEDQRIKIY
jgi:hypothetical protein